MCDAPEPPRLDEVTALAERFRRLGMATHVELVRAYWLAKQRGLKAGWDDATVLRWLRVLRVGEHAAYYPVRPRNQPCVDCSAAGRPAQPYTMLVWPEGSLSQCHTCKAEWLELNQL